jgi:hypothetical protein
MINNVKATVPLQKLLASKGLLFKITLAIVAVIIILGAFVGLFGGFGYGLFSSNVPAETNAGPVQLGTNFGSPADSSNNPANAPSFNGAQNIAVSSGTTAVASSTVQTNSQGSSSNANPQKAATNGSSNGGSVEFFSNLTLSVSSASGALNKADAIAYAYGGYIAFSSYQNESSLAVLRIPASNYQTALGQVESIGTVSSLQSTSNDVSVKVTDLNATLQSLFTEEASLLKLENQSTSLNNTLAIESQIQGLNAQINEIESELLQTNLLIDYSTITAAFYQEGVAQQLSVKISATPQSGEEPLGVTFTAIVSGGAPPYIIYFDFGDGNSYEGASVIHTFYNAGTFNVTATVTDSSGNAKEVWMLIHATSPTSNGSYLNFFYYVGGLFVSVLEGIVEVAVVVVPIALIIGAVILPIRSRLRQSSTKRVEQSKTSS